MTRRTLLTSESVTEGHPDKVCDQISDAVLDACLRRDPRARVACEASIKTDGSRQWVAVYGETTPSIAAEEVDRIVRRVLREIGYTDVELGASCDEVEVHVVLSTQSGDIAQGVNVAFDDQTTFFVNPTGRFVTGGPAGDSGLTGRKIIVDTYGGIAHHGGGAFSGKDPTKVDRSAAYAARWVAKTVVAAGLAQRCEVQLAYAIGVARPVSVAVETFGTATVAAEQIEAAVEEVFDLRPGAIISDLDLRRPIYRPTATYGHFGRTDLGVTWESVDRVDALRKAATS